MQRTDPILEVKNLVQDFPVRTDVFGRPDLFLRAVDNVSFAIRPGETLGLVGESGCGKSTLARTVLRLYEPTSGSVHFCGTDVRACDAASLRSLRRDMQIILQDPAAALNPRRTIGESIAEGFVVHGQFTPAERRTRVAELLERVGLRPQDAARYPHEFSGGQRQRICIARALALKPKLIIADEAVSSLDVSVQAQILNLMSELQREFGLTYLFISHNLGVVRRFCNRVAVMYLGRIVEQADVNQLFESPVHPYTRALISAVPQLEPDRPRNRILLSGDIPSPLRPPRGCRFHTRCHYAVPACEADMPPLIETKAGHSVACIRTDVVPHGPIQ